MITQDSTMFYNDVALCNDGSGAVVLSQEMGKKMAAALGDKKAMIHQNHGADHHRRFGRRRRLVGLSRSSAPAKVSSLPKQLAPRSKSRKPSAKTASRRRAAMSPAGSNSAVLGRTRRTRTRIPQLTCTGQITRLRRCKNSSLTKMLDCLVPCRGNVCPGLRPISNSTVGDAREPEIWGGSGALYVWLRGAIHPRVLLRRLATRLDQTVEPLKMSRSGRHFLMQGSVG